MRPRTARGLGVDPARPRHRQRLLWGHEKLSGEGIEFWGQSFVAGPAGEILARADAQREETLLVDLDLARIESTRTHWPFLRDRRIDAYGEITRRFLG